VGYGYNLYNAGSATFAHRASIEHAYVGTRPFLVVDLERQRRPAHPEHNVIWHTALRVNNSTLSVSSDGLLDLTGGKVDHVMRIEGGSSVGIDGNLKITSELSSQLGTRGCVGEWVRAC
jgi:hypothetical protein